MTLTPTIEPQRSWGGLMTQGPGASVSAGDVLYVYAQASPDATLAGINIAFIGQQSPA